MTDTSGIIFQTGRSVVSSDVRLGIKPPHLDPAEFAQLREIATTLAQLVPEITAGLVDLLPQVFPELQTQLRDPTAMSASITDNLQTMWAMIAGGLSADDVEAPPSALVLPRQLVYDQVPAMVLLRVYYVGHAMIWHRWVEPLLRSLSQDGHDVSMVSSRLHADTFNYLDRSAVRVLKHYESERASALSAGRRSRSAIAYEVLAGSVLSPASRRQLEFRLDEPHVAWVLWAPGSPLDQQDALVKTAQAVHQLLGTGDHLTLTHGPHEVWGWTGRPVNAVDARADLMLAVSAPSESASDPPAARRNGRFRGQAGLHLAISAPSRGADGFREGLADARSLQAAISAAKRPAPSVHTSEEAGLAALLLADPRAARRFARSHLHGLAGTDENSAVLRETVLEFLSNGGSFKRTASALNIHRNTVLYRLRRAENELDHPLQLPADELMAALIIASWLG